MDLYKNDKIHGVPEGVSYGQYDRVDELNNRMNARNISDSALEPNFNIRPVSTKYAHFPIMDRQPDIREQPKIYPNYRLNSNFNPGNDRAPVSGYFSNVDLETNLRNQNFALQHGAPQGVYVPTSESELYKVHVVSQPTEQPHPDLVTQESFSKAVHPNLQNTQIGNDRFFNHTRTQLRDTMQLFCYL